MVFDKSKYATDNNGLTFNKINTNHYDKVIEGLSIRSNFEESDCSHYYAKRIDVSNIKPNFLMLRKPLVQPHAIRISMSTVAPLNNAISINLQDMKFMTQHADTPHITNGIKNRAYFLTNPKDWPKIMKTEINENTIKIEENIKD